MRKSIRSGDPWTVRIWLTYFQLYRVIEIPGKVKLQSITAMTTMSPDFLKGWILFLNKWLPCFFREIGYNHLATSWESGRSSGATPGITIGLGEDLITFVARLVAGWITFKWEGVPCNLKPKLLALYKSGPNSSGVHEKSWVDGRKVTKVGKDGKPHPCLSATNTGAIFTDASQWMEHHPELYKSFVQWLDIVNDRNLTRIFHVASLIIPWVRERALKDGYNPFKYPGFGRPLGLGKLGYKIEPAGKIRTFAMVDSLTQCAMKPLHDLLFSILRKLETDGTFDQMKPAQRLINLGFTSFWSLDLSSATDRFPLALQQVLLSVLIGPKLAKLWAVLLVKREYLAPAYLPNGESAGLGVYDDTGKPASVFVTYGAGQPMGALTSWAAFSLTHHCLVQYAAYRSTGLIRFFKDYALLGDDIVIANHDVALKYQALLLEIGVEYGLAKSLISHTGGFEFAKRTFAKGKDVSGISLLAVGSAKADHAILEQILTRFGVNSSLMETLRRASKVLGYGYRSLARLPAVLGTKSRLQGLAILLSRPGSPWGLEVIQWLLQWQPGLKWEVPREVHLAIGERLWDSLLAKTQAAIQSHKEGLSKILLPDGNYGGNIDVWFDKSALHEHSWNVYVVIPLVAELRQELNDLQKALDALVRPDLDDLNEIWLRIDELRDSISAIPAVPNFFERSSLDFGGARRSALIRAWRQVRSWLTIEVACNLHNNVLPIKGMAMDEGEGTALDQIHEVEVPIESPMEIDVHQKRDPEIPRPSGPLTMLSPRFGVVTEVVLTASGPTMNLVYGLIPNWDGSDPEREAYLYRLRWSSDIAEGLKPEKPTAEFLSIKPEMVFFTENDIHLDGIYHREDMPYSLVVDHLTPLVKARVVARLRDEQYDDM
jgi:hypothetical protein